MGPSQSKGTSPASSPPGSPTTKRPCGYVDPSTPVPIAMATDYGGDFAQPVLYGQKFTVQVNDTSWHPYMWAFRENDGTTCMMLGTGTSGTAVSMWFDYAAGSVANSSTAVQTYRGTPVRFGDTVNLVVERGEGGYDFSQCADPHDCSPYLGTSVDSCSSLSGCSSAVLAVGYGIFNPQNFLFPVDASQSSNARFVVSDTHSSASASNAGTILQYGQAFYFYSVQVGGNPYGVLETNNGTTFKAGVGGIGGPFTITLFSTDGQTAPNVPEDWGTAGPCVTSRGSDPTQPSAISLTITTPPLPAGSPAGTPPPASTYAFACVTQTGPGSPVSPTQWGAAAPPPQINGSGPSCPTAPSPAPPSPKCAPSASNCTKGVCGEDYEIEWDTTKCQYGCSQAKKPPIGMIIGISAAVLIVLAIVLMYKYFSNQKQNAGDSAALAAVIASG